MKKYIYIYNSNTQQEENQVLRGYGPNYKERQSSANLKVFTCSAPSSTSEA